MLAHRNAMERSVRSRMQKIGKSSILLALQLILFCCYLQFSGHKLFPSPMLQTEGCSQTRELINIYTASFIQTHHFIIFILKESIFMRFCPYSVHEHHTLNNHISQHSCKGKSAGEWGCPSPGLTLWTWTTQIAGQIGMSQRTFGGAFTNF